MCDIEARARWRNSGALVRSATSVPGFDLVSDELDVHDPMVAPIRHHRRAISTSRASKARSSAACQAMAADLGKPVVRSFGDAAPEVTTRIDHISLADTFAWSGQ